MHAFIHTTTWLHMAVGQQNYYTVQQINQTNWISTVLFMTTATKNIPLKFQLFLITAEHKIIKKRKLYA